MAIITTDSKNYTDIAAAIRSKNGLETQYKPSEMAAAISAIVAGGSSNLDIQHIISSRRTASSEYVIFEDWATVIPDFSKVIALLIYHDSSSVLCLKENFENQSAITGGIFVPGQMFSVLNDTFTTWDVNEYKTGLRFYDTKGISMTMNNRILSPGSKEAMFIIQERS